MHSLVPPKDHVRPSFPEILERKGRGFSLRVTPLPVTIHGDPRERIFFPGKDAVPRDEFVAVYRRGGMRLC